MRTNALPWAALTAIIVAVLVCAVPAPAATIGIIGNVSWQPTPGGGNATRLNSGPGGNVIIDPVANPWIRIDIAVRTSQHDHMGVANIVYDLASPEAKAKGYMLNHLNPDGESGAYRAWSGFKNVGGPPTAQNMSAPYYEYALSSPPAYAYTGGWGFTNSGLPHQGITHGIPGSLFGAGESLPLIWSGDQSPAVAGIQSFARLGVGQSVYTAPADDPVLGGHTLGFGTDVANGIGGGDGSWWFHSIFIETVGWDRQTYRFILTPTAGTVLRSGIDYSQPQQGGFRESVTGSDLRRTEVSFTLIPEPAFTVFLLGSVALIRRR